MVHTVEIKWHPVCIVHTTVYISAHPPPGVCVSEVSVAYYCTFIPVMDEVFVCVWGGIGLISACRSTDAVMAVRALVFPFLCFTAETS